MPAPRVLFLDDDDDLRDTFAEVIERTVGGVCLSLGSHAELVAHRREALACDLAILDVNLGPGLPSGLDAYHWLRGAHFRGPIVFLTGHASAHPLVAEAQRLGDARVIAKPASMAALQEVIGWSGPP